MASNPVYITEPLYLYEPSGIGKDERGRVAREAIVARIVANRTHDEVRGESTVQCDEYQKG